MTVYRQNSCKNIEDIPLFHDLAIFLLISKIYTSISIKKGIAQSLIKHEGILHIYYTNSDQSLTGLVEINPMEIWIKTF